MTRKASRRTIWVGVALALILAALVGSAFDAQRGGPSAAGRPEPRIGASIARRVRTRRQRGSPMWGRDGSPAR